MWWCGSTCSGQHSLAQHKVLGFRHDENDAHNTQCHSIVKFPWEQNPPTALFRTEASLIENTREALITQYHSILHRKKERRTTQSIVEFPWNFISKLTDIDIPCGISRCLADDASDTVWHGGPEQSGLRST